MRTRYTALLMVILMAVSSVSFLAVVSTANDLNEPVEYRDEQGEIIGDKQYGIVPNIQEHYGFFYPELDSSVE
ncbi:MAG: hypothetical protein IJ519_02525, partial [Clostridia bacterium]|nr:hypothetical protein [Clostridia bacterium]